MSNVLQISPRLWQLKMGMVNSFLLTTDDGLLLIDAGWPGQAEKIFSAVRESGHTPRDIRHLLLTHGHIDHAGSAAEVQRRTGAQTYAHAIELELITIPAIVYRLLIKPGGTKYEPVTIDHVLQNGELLAIASDIEIIHSPGHCAGQVVLLLRNDGVLIAGDLCSNIMGLSYSVLNEDISLARETLLRVAKYPFDRAVFGHGKPLNNRANQRLKERFSDPKLR
ncbi:MAG: hypothetical protein BGO55_30415 [Sphingobacteriales bacterium 50-39]|nr:MBL fold metallo-hydrolase [Sphingobacteriales bacterium]OJW60834.1 MAG: hypothetical protein BGO55_30415 [Sphingobacteriales bacterium 50-39]